MLKFIQNLEEGKLFIVKAGHKIHSLIMHCPELFKLQKNTNLKNKIQLLIYQLLMGGEMS